MATQAERRQSTRSRLLRAAGDLMAERGFEAVTVDMVTTRAGVARATFYQHFESKIDLLVGLIRERLGTTAPALLQGLDGGRPAREVLDGFLAGVCGWFEAHRALAEAVVQHSLRKGPLRGPRSPEASTRGMMEAILAAGQRQGTVRADVPARTLSEILAGVMAQATLAWCREGEEGELWSWMREFLAVFWQGAEPRC